MPFIVPNDILRVIFDFSASEPFNSHYCASSSVSSVCSTWRTVALGMSSLWQHLVLDTSRVTDHTKLRDKAEIWLSRSKTRRIDVSIIYGSRLDVLIPLISYVESAAQRWRKITFRGKKAQPVKFFAVENKECAVTVLDSISLLAAYNVNAPDDEFSWVVPENPTRIGIEIRIPGGVDGCGRSIGPVNSLRCLSIHRYDVVMAGDACNQTVALLPSFPRLETLELFGESRPDNNHILTEACVTHSSLKIEMNNLTSIRTKVVHNLHCLFSHIVAPNLKKLQIFQPAGTNKTVVGFAGAATGDYHTVVGIALRSLYRHCTPPIKDLSLDCTNLLPTEHQWIVKSCRSLERLKFSYSIADADVVTLMQPGVDSCPPLPCLSHLTLVSSSKISGQVLIDTLQMRLQLAKEGKISQLRLLNVAHCARVTQEHCSRLRHLLKETNIRFGFWKNL